MRHSIFVVTIVVLLSVFCVFAQAAAPPPAKSTQQLQRIQDEIAQLERAIQLQERQVLAPDGKMEAGPAEGRLPRTGIDRLMRRLNMEVRVLEQKTLNAKSKIEGLGPVMKRMRMLQRKQEQLKTSGDGHSKSNLLKEQEALKARIRLKRSLQTSPLAGSIAGTIIDSATSAAIPNVMVWIYDSDGAATGYAYTDAAGNYSLGVTPGTYYAQTSNPLGYVDELYNNIVCEPWCWPPDGTPITVVDEQASQVNFALDIGGTISGQVLDTNGIPLGDIKVTIFDSSGNDIASGFTDVFGNYTVGGLYTGTFYSKTDDFQGYVNKLYDGIVCMRDECDVLSGDPISVTGGVDTPGINFHLDWGGTISGMLTDMVTGLPLMYGYVQAFTSSGQVLFENSLDATGHYSIGGLATGNYLVRTFMGDDHLNEIYDDIPCPGYCDVTAGTLVPVVAGQNTPSINFVLDIGGSISGTVTDAPTSTPLAGIELAVYDLDGNFRSYAYTDASGAYTVKGLFTGYYRARTYNSSGYVNELYYEQACMGQCDLTYGNPVWALANNNTPDIDFTLDFGGSISGAITDAANSAPLAPVTIDVYNDHGTEVGSTYTDGSGSYSIPGLITGNYYAVTSNWLNYLDELWDNIPCVRGNCIVTSGTPIAVTLGSATPDVNFQLDLGGSVSGMVTDAATGDPIPSVVVDIVDSGGTYMSYSYTDDTGGYFAPGLDSGTYFAWTWSRDYVDELYDNIPDPAHTDAWQGTPIEVARAATTGGIDFALDFGGSISGTVTDAVSSEPLDVQVLIEDASGYWTKASYTDGSGNYSIGGLPTGTYHAMAIDPYDWNGPWYFDEIYDNIRCRVFYDCDLSTGAPIDVTLGIDTPGIDFALKKGGNIAGFVTDSVTLTPIPNAYVAMYDAAGVQASFGYTDGSGFYATLLVMPGDYTAIASASGYHRELYSEIPCNWCDPTTGTPIAVMLEQTTPIVHFTLSPNTPPEAAGDYFDALEDTTLDIPAPGVLINDMDMELDPLRALLDSQPNNGTVILNYDGSFTYVPNPNFNGTDQFLYHVSDGSAESSAVPVTIAVAAVSDPPLAADDTYSIDQGLTLDVAAPGVLGNDTDPDGDPLTAFPDSAPANGTLTLNADGSFTYVPNPGFVGSDSFVYHASDEIFSSNPATVTINVIQPCLFCDDFEDNTLDPSWNQIKPAWTETGGQLAGTPVGRKAIIVNNFTGCQVCSSEAEVITAGGDYNKVWMLGWYQDKRNTMELLIKEENDKIILKQRVGGSIIKKNKGTVTITPGTPVKVKVAFDGTQFTVTVNDAPLFTLTPDGTVPVGSVGFQVKNTTGYFNYITVNQ